MFKKTAFLPMLVTVLACSSAGSEENVLPAGTERVRGADLEPFEATWSSRVKRGPEADWQDGNQLKESLRAGKLDGVDVWIREQARTGASGAGVTTTVYMRRSTLEPIKVETKGQGQLPPQAPVDGTLHYDGKTVSGSVTNGAGDTTEIAAEGELPLFDGGVLGLVIAAMPLDDGFEAEIPVFFSQLQIVYMVRARVVGKRDFAAAGGAKVEAIAVKTDWRDTSTNEPYPDDDSGGTFYVVPSPPQGFPHVPKYINANFDTEVITSN